MNIALAVTNDRTTFQTLVSTTCCPSCGCLLTLHQPDLELPDRLLATCDDCKSWYLTIPERGTLRSIQLI